MLLPMTSADKSGEGMGLMLRTLSTVESNTSPFGSLFEDRYMIIRLLYATNSLSMRRRILSLKTSSTEMKYLRMYMFTTESGTLGATLEARRTRSC